MRPKPAAFSDACLPLFAPAPADTRKCAPQPSYIRDHRRRLRDRFLAGGAAAMPDYEMLELVLFRAIPRRDVKPLAHALLARFGDFAGVLSAPAEQLDEIDGIGPAVIAEFRIVEAAAHRLAQARVRGRPAISSWTALIAYCRASMAHRGTEQFRVFYLDRKNVLIADEEQARGTVDHVPVYPREVVKRALELSATAIILVHNHPSGDPTPSRADIAMTRSIIDIAKPLGVAVHDHIIVGRQGDASFRGLKLI